MTPSAIELRPAVPADLAAILALERATENAPHWPRAAYVAILAADLSAAPLRSLFVADRDGLLVGFAVAHVDPASIASSARVAELESIAVAPAMRRSGIGRALCAAVLDWCRLQAATEIVLEVRAASAGAIALYSSLGFAEIGSRPRYYHDPEDDALLMRLPLAGISAPCSLDP